MLRQLRVGVLGDFNPAFHSHVATNAAIEHSAARLGIGVEIEWLPTPSLLDERDSPQSARRTRKGGGTEAMEACDGLWASPGSPYASFDGMLRGIEFARTRNWPFVGT